MSSAGSGPLPPPAEAEVIPFVTPINLVLFAFAAYLLYINLRSPPPPPPPPSHEPLVFQKFTPKTLQPYNGSQNPRILMAVNKKVFDVTPGRNFYGPNGPYENFAGRDASRGLAKGSFSEDMLTEVDKTIDKLEDLTDEERRTMHEWEHMFEGKYLLVGELVENSEVELGEEKKE